MKGDYRGRSLYEQIDAELEQMQWTLGSVDGVSRHVPEVAEYNDKSVQGPDGKIYYPSDETAVTLSQALTYVESTYIAPLLNGSDEGEEKRRQALDRRLTRAAPFAAYPWTPQNVTGHRGNQKKLILSSIFTCHERRGSYHARAG